MADDPSTRNEPANEPATQADPPQDDPPADLSQTDDEPLGEAGKKALQREREARKAAERAAAEAAAKVKEFEDRDKTEQQRALERAEAAEKAAAEAQREALRYRIATRHQISDEDAETFLTGADEAALTRQAERLVALRGEANAPRVPKPDPSQGPRGPVDINAQIADAEQRGDLKESMRLKNRRLMALAAESK